MTSLGDRLRRRNLRKQLRSLADGERGKLDLDWAADPEATVEVAAFAQALPVRSAAVRRLRAALRPETRHGLIDLLEAPSLRLRVSVVRLCGALELDEAVPWLELRLADRKADVREAAARALGRIGGHRAADALLSALESRSAARHRLVIELARAAPKLYLDQALSEPGWQRERPALILALGLRRRLALDELLAGLSWPQTADLVAICHVVARSHDERAAAWLAGLQDAADQRVRGAAQRALRRVRGVEVAPAAVALAGAGA